MGHHYVPQAHLRRFEIPEKPGSIWMYDKQAKIFRDLPIKNVAQEAEFYTPDVESWLARQIESPSNPIIAKLRSNMRLSNAERTQLSIYMMTMATRGPKLRRESFGLVPEALLSTYENVKKELEDWIAEEGPDVEFARARLKELEVVRAKFENDIPKNIIEQIRTPYLSDNCIEAVHNMAWHIIPAPPTMHFVTGDTPAHFFQELGVGTLQSEFTFTVSSDLALIGEHTRKPAITIYEDPQSAIAKEINRRIISHADRFVFSRKNDGWVKTLADKKPNVGKIEWL